MSDMKLFLELLVKNSGFKAELNNSGSAVSRFASNSRREFEALRGAMGSVQGKLASLGVSLGVLQQLSASAKLDKGLTQVKQTAGGSREMVQGLRRDIFEMARETGRDVEGLKDGFDSLIQSGQSWKAARESTRGINIASAVTGANEKTLAGGLTVGATAFDIDLERPGKALEMLDKMTVAGRLGNAELENLSDIFARVGVNAASAGMGFDKTLAFIEGLSLVERQPERLATLADSTLRLFTNLRYMAQAQKGSGVKFFADDGSRRDPLAVLSDIKKRWDGLKTDKSRAIFIQQVAGKADLDTIKGLKTLLSGDALGKVGGFTKQIASAGGTLQRDLPEAVANAVDQTGRLKASLREAADGFAQPINKTLADLIQWSLDKKKNGGLELSGKDIMLGGGAMALGTLLTARYGSRGIGALAGKLLANGTSTAIGVAEGKVLEETTGVKPVFITNWPASIGGGTPFGNGGGKFNPAEWGGGSLRNMGGSGGPGAGAPPAALKWLAGATVVGAVVGPLAEYTSAAARENGWGGRTVNRSDREYEVMGVGGRRGEVKNDIKVEINIDALGRTFVQTGSPNTSATIEMPRRGSIFEALTGMGY